jgi:hypothetical protein
MILLISVSWIARITGVSHWCPAQNISYFCNSFWNKSYTI